MNEQIQAVEGDLRKQGDEKCDATAQVPGHQLEDVQSTATVRTSNAAEDTKAGHSAEFREFELRKFHSHNSRVNCFRAFQAAAIPRDTKIAELEATIVAMREALQELDSCCHLDIPEYERLESTKAVLFSDCGKAFLKRHEAFLETLLEISKDIGSTNAAELAKKALEGVK